MTYTVHEAAKLSGVTIKTLYYYQKIGLLPPKRISANGYRLYGSRELELLQQILFYRELDFPLDKIKLALQNEPSRLQCLREQKALLKNRQQRIKKLLYTLNEAISYAEKGLPMNTTQMFTGLSRQEWDPPLSEQGSILPSSDDSETNTTAALRETLNVNANETKEFMAQMSKFLQNGVSVNDESVHAVIEKHLRFLQLDMPFNAKNFAAQSRFLLNNDLLRQMLEEQQPGLSYYLCFAAESYAAS